MLRVLSILIVGVLIVLSPAAAWAAGGTTGNKPTTNKDYAQKQQKQSGGAFSWIKRNLIPSWKQRYDARRNTLWSKPSGGHFTTPASRTKTRKPGFIRRRFIAIKRHTGRFFQHLRTAWRARWKNRHVNADRQTALQNQSKFGTNVRRPHKHVAYSWRTRFDCGKRLRKPVAMGRTKRRKPRFGPRKPPHRRHRRPPPPPGWQR